MKSVGLFFTFFLSLSVLSMERQSSSKKPLPKKQVGIESQLVKSQIQASALLFQHEYMKFMLKYSKIRKDLAESQRDAFALRDRYRKEITIKKAEDSDEMIVSMYTDFSNDKIVNLVLLYPEVVTCTTDQGIEFNYGSPMMSNVLESLKSTQDNYLKDYYYKSFLLNKFYSNAVLEKEFVKRYGSYINMIVTIMNMPAIWLGKNLLFEQVISQFRIDAFTAKARVDSGISDTLFYDKSDDQAIEGHKKIADNYFQNIDKWSKLYAEHIVNITSLMKQDPKFIHYRKQVEFVNLQDETGKIKTGRKEMSFFLPELLVQKKGLGKLSRAAQDLEPEEEKEDYLLDNQKLIKKQFETGSKVVVDDPENDIVITIFKTDNNVYSIFARNIQYTPWVMAWFQDPQKALEDQGYYEKNSIKNALREKNQGGVVLVHSFSREVDELLPLYSKQSSVLSRKFPGQTDRCLVLPGSIRFNDTGNVSTGVFVYLFSSKTGLCYHRGFQKKSGEQLIKEYKVNGAFDVDLSDAHILNEKN